MLQSNELNLGDNWLREWKMNMRFLLWMENSQRCGYEGGETLVSLTILPCDNFTVRENNS